MTFLKTFRSQNSCTVPKLSKDLTLKFVQRTRFHHQSYTGNPSESEVSFSLQKAAEKELWDICGKKF